MALTLEQFFLTGRFHATRWNQSPFEDRHGEWPPSPYRLLRTLAARWFEHTRETGDRDEAARDALLRDLAAADPPAFNLPANATHSAAWSARGLKQYQPLGLEKFPAPKKGEPHYWSKKAITSLVVDSFAMLPPDAAVLWHWSTLELAPERLALLDALLRRITYFGRAESLCLMRRRDPARPAPESNCTLALGAGAGSPVLAPDPATPMDVSLLLAHNDDARLRGRRIPPGTRWLHAVRPPRPVAFPHARPAPAPRRAPVRTLQFAIGGRVFPPEKSWVQITERFRGTVLHHLRGLVTGRRGATAKDLTAEQRHAIRLMTGKEADETPLRDGHAHAFFFLLPDRAGHPTRLLCHRTEPFTYWEEEALLAASETPLPWEYGNPEWLLRLVPLPAETSLPPDGNIFATATRWRSLTPYVPARYVFAANGKPKPGESVEEQIARDLVQTGHRTLPIMVKVNCSRWIKAHRPGSDGDGTTNRDKRGYDVTLTFAEAVKGPFALGRSSHFGLGLFAPEFAD